MFKINIPKSKKQQHIKLSWLILTCKFLYYEKHNHKVPEKYCITDANYDILETKYKQLSTELGLEPTATNMVGFDYNRPSCMLVYNSLKNSNYIKELLDYEEFLKC